MGQPAFPERSFGFARASGLQIVPRSKPRRRALDDEIAAALVREGFTALVASAAPMCGAGSRRRRVDRDAGEFQIPATLWTMRDASAI